MVVVVCLKYCGSSSGGSGSSNGSVSSSGGSSYGSVSNSGGSSYGSVSSSGGSSDGWYRVSRCSYSNSSNEVVTK